MKANSGNIFFTGVLVVVGLILIYSFSGEQLDEQYNKTIQKFRDEKNKMFKTSDESPLDRKQKKVFDSLSYFPINSAFKVEAKIVKLPLGEIVTINTTGNKPRKYRKFALAQFNLGGQSHELLLLQATDRLSESLHKSLLFLAFTDLTSGEDTYGAGRYIDIEKPEGETVVIDFNMAYNPYCAYNSTYDCPIPPQENNLSIAIQAGEKNFGTANY